MEEVYSSNSGQQFFNDVNTRLRNLEEKQRLINERVILTGKTFVEEREKNFTEIQTMKKTVFQLKEETAKMKEFLQRVSEQLSTLARKEELMTLQRQFDLFRIK